MRTVIDAEVLPGEVVQLVLQHVPLSDRVGQCGCVCSSWRTAANAATTTIDVEVNDSSSSSSLSTWLSEHGQPLEQLTLAAYPKSTVGDPSDIPSVNLGIPFKQLANLCSLALTSFVVEDYSTSAAAGGATVSPLTGAAAAAAASSSQALNSLAALTKLTSLQLTNVQVCLTPLSALSSLQQLEIVDATDSEGADVDTALQCALQQLTQLTRLHILLDGLGDAGLAPVQKLQKLQQLMLNYAAGQGNTGVTAASFAALPSSLTCLVVEGCYDSPIVFSSSSTPGLCQLTGLQQLQLSWQRVQPDVLSSLQQLRHLELYDCTLLGDAAGTGTAVLLGVLPKLTQLQHLDLNSTLPDWDAEDIEADAAAYAALTASTQLTHLNLDECQLAPGACKHMFREGRQLALQSLNLLLSENLDLQEVEQTLRCLPALTDLSLDGSQLGLAVGDEIEEEAAALQLSSVLLKLRSELPGLTHLVLMCLPGTADALSQLALLTGLRDLMIGAPVSPQDVLILTPLKQLQALKLYAVVSEAGDYDFELVNTADEGLPSNYGSMRWKSGVSWAGAAAVSRIAMELQLGWLGKLYGSKLFQRTGVLWYAAACLKQRKALCVILVYWLL